MNGQKHDNFFAKETNLDWVPIEGHKSSRRKGHSNHSLCKIDDHKRIRINESKDLKANYVQQFSI